MSPVYLTVYSCRTASNHRGPHVRSHVETARPATTLNAKCNAKCTLFAHPLCQHAGRAKLPACAITLVAGCVIPVQASSAARLL